MRDKLNFLNFGKRKKKKRNIEVSKIFNFENLIKSGTFWAKVEWC